MNQHNKYISLVLLMLALFLSTIVLPVIAQKRPQRPAPSREQIESRKLDSLIVSTEQPPTSTDLQVVARVYPDSIVLRWAPPSPELWRKYGTIGYVVERAELDTLTSLDASAYRTLVQSPLRAWTLAEWRERADTTNKYAAIAVQCLHGRLHIPTAVDGGQGNPLADARDEFRNRYGFALFAADMDAVAARGLGLRFADASAEKDKKYIYRISPMRRDSIYPLEAAYIVVDSKEPHALPPVIMQRMEEKENSVKVMWRNPYVFTYSAFNVYRREKAGGRSAKLNSSPVIAASRNEISDDYSIWFTDTTCGMYTRYEYFVRGIDAFGEEGPMSMPTPGMGRDVTPPPSPVIIEVIPVTRTAARIKWQLEETDDLRGFVVMRSGKPDGPWSVRGSGQIGNRERMFIDDSIFQGLTYYAVLAIDTAGNMSGYNPKALDVHDTLPPAAPSHVTYSVSKDGVVTLKWKANSEEDMLGYRILRSDDISHEFTQLTNQVYTDTVYQDTIEISTLRRQLLYQIAALDNRFFESELTVIVVKLPDVVPPSPPILTDVRPDADAIFVMWQASASADVAFTLVERWHAASADTGGWITVARSAALTMFEDRMVTSGELYEYRVRAVDSAGNLSAPSAALQTRPLHPDTGGVTCSLQEVEFRTDSNAIVLSWNTLGYVAPEGWFIIYRRHNNGVLAPYNSVPATSTSFRDINLIGPGRYYYAVRYATHRREGSLSAVGDTLVE